MSDVFISYARSTEREAKAIGQALRGLGYGVWRDDEIPAHRAFAEVIEERLSASKAVVVVWSADAVASEWVRSEANRARADRKLIQLRVDETRPPMPFDQIQCTDLVGWSGDADHPGWMKVAASVGDLVGVGAQPTQAARSAKVDRPGRMTICVLPFANISDDPQQEYFSDGISEDIITDLSKVSALSVTARNTAFTFKGRSLDIPEIARKLGVGHVLEGSVRKAGNRLRITAQLIDGRVGDHIWAERWDRDLNDIFALQDEISQAIVVALKVKLLPGEWKAIAERGTTSPEAYNLYLMARGHYLAGNNSGRDRLERMVRLCERAVGLDPLFAQAWSLLAIAQGHLHRQHWAPEDGMQAAERALGLDPRLAEAHAVKATFLNADGNSSEADAELELALELQPMSYEVNMAAGAVNYERRRLAEARMYFERAAGAGEGDFDSTAMLISIAAALGDSEARAHAAGRTFTRAERAVVEDPLNFVATAYGAYALAALGDRDRAKEWIDRALLGDSDNLSMRYNMVCAASAYLQDLELSLELCAPFLATCSSDFLRVAKSDPDLDLVRDDPRFQAMMVEAEARLRQAEGPSQAPC